ncbi:MAG: hypothetical protein AB1817_06740 [Chloroflexota bacterium]
MSRRTRSNFAALLFGALMFLFLGVAVTFADSPRALRSKTVRIRSGNPAGGLGWSDAITSYLYFPVVLRGYASEAYGTVAVIDNSSCRASPTDPPAENHPDINLAVRGYVGTTGTLGLVTIPFSPSDTNAPQLYTLFADNRTPAFSAVYQVYDWDWLNNRRGALIADPSVTLAGLVVTTGESIRVPASGYDIGLRALGYEVMVLYAAANRITLKYTREDNAICGYTIHIENIQVDPNLLALYQTMNAAGRTRLPALYAGQSVGRPITTEIGVAIRDTGSFMDPRSRTDWWQGR